MIFNFKRKNKKKYNVIQKINLKYVDKHIYFFLVIFIIICIAFNLNNIQMILTSIIFIALMYGAYVMKFKFKNNFLLKDKYLDIVDNLKLEELKQYTIIYYTKCLNYKFLDEENMIIEKNNHKYAIKFFIEELKPDNLNNMKKYHNIDGVIIITNKDLPKEILKLIKQKSFFSLTRPGVLGMVKEVEKLDIKKGENNE